MRREEIDPRDRPRLFSHMPSVHPSIFKISQWPSGSLMTTVLLYFISYGNFHYLVHVLLLLAHSTDFSPKILNVFTARFLMFFLHCLLRIGNHK